MGIMEASYLTFIILRIVNLTCLLIKKYSASYFPAPPYKEVCKFYILHNNML